MTPSRLTTPATPPKSSFINSDSASLKINSNNNILSRSISSHQLSNYSVGTPPRKGTILSHSNSGLESKRDNSHNKENTSPTVNSSNLLSIAPPLLHYLETPSHYPYPNHLQ